MFASVVGTALDAANVRRSFRSVVRAAGLDPTEWTPRELRHSFVSLLSDKGVPIEKISTLVGHNGTRVTELVYRQQLRPVIQDGADAMDSIFPGDSAWVRARLARPVVGRASLSLCEGLHLRMFTMTVQERSGQPPDGDEFSIMIGWLAFHRDALAVKCAGLDPVQLATRSVPPSRLSLLGIMRHMTEMERAYGVWALGPRSALAWVWGEYSDNGPEWDIDVDASMSDESAAAWEREKQATDQRVRQHGILDSVGAGNGHSVRWNLQKLIGEYARHNGHADLIRERIDGQTGE